MRLLIVTLALTGMSLSPSAQDSASRLNEASDRIARALNAYSTAEEPIRSRLTTQQELGTALFFAAATALGDNSESLSVVCQLQQLSKSQVASKEKIVEPLLEQYRASNAQQTANISLALPLLPPDLRPQATFVMITAKSAAAVIDRGC
jgi:hypothetical protein